MRTGLRGLLVVASLLLAGITVSADEHKSYTAMVEEVGDFDRTSLSSIKSQNSLLHTAVGNLLGLGYVKHAVLNAAANMQNPEYVLRGTTLYKNALGYHEFYIQLDLREKGVQAPDYSFNFIYQDTSTQGNHGPTRGHSDWMVLKASTVEAQWNKLTQKLDSPDDTGTRAFQPIGQLGYMDPVQLAFRTSAAFQRFLPEMDGNTISWVNWKDKRNNVKYAAVSFMTKNIPYVTSSRSVTVLYKYIAGGYVEMADDVWMASEFLKPLESVVTNEESSIPYEQFAEVALERARTQPLTVSSGGN